MTNEVAQRTTDCPQYASNRSPDLTDAAIVSAAMRRRTRQFRASISFVSIDQRDPQDCITLWDNLSNISLMHPDAVPEGALWVTKQKSEISGVVKGATTLSQGVVRIGICFTWGGQWHLVDFKVAPTPNKSHILIGIPEMHALKAFPDLHANRVFLNTTNRETVYTDDLDTVCARNQMTPLTVLSLCDGLGTAYIVLRSAGIRISRYVAVELNENIRTIAKSNCPQIEHRGHDVLSRTAMVEILDGSFCPSLFIATPKCVAWSVAKRKPEGFQDKEAATLKASAHWWRRVKNMNPRCHYFIETVVPHASLRHDEAKQEELFQVKFQETEAAYLQQTNRRPRRIATDMVEFDQIPRQRHPNPAFVLEDNRYPIELPFPCLVSRGLHTHRVPKIGQFGSPGVIYAPTVSEAERMMGYSTGITMGYLDSNLGLTEDFRRELIGGCVCFGHFWTAFRALGCSTGDAVHVTSARLHKLDPQMIYSATAEQAELWLTQLSAEDLLDYCMRAVTAFGPPVECTITVDSTKIPFQSKRRIAIQQPLQVPARAKLNYMVEKAKSIERVEYSPDQWIHDLLFLKKDPERVDKLTGEIAVRPIGVLCAINAAHSYDQHLVEESPTIADARQRIPVGSTYMVSSDDQDGYSAITVAKDSRKYLCLGFWDTRTKMYEIYQCTRMPQGLSTAGVLYPAWIHDIFNRCFGKHWRGWWVDHVDDLLAHADSESRAWNRYLLSRAAKDVCGVKLSSKCTPSSLPVQHHVGLTWQRGSIRASDAVRTSLKIACEMRPTTVKQGRRVQGLVNQCLLAIDWSPTELTYVAEIQTGWTQSIKTTPFVWTEENIRGQNDILTRQADVDWVYWDPDYVVSQTRSLLILTDKSQTQLGMALFTVAKADASTITPADLNDRNITGILDLGSKKLNAAQLKYHTSEGELLGGVEGCKRYGKFVTSVTANYKPTDKKVALATDSTPAMGKWKIFRMPTVQSFDFLNAKSQRLFTWIDTISYTQHWPMTLMHFPGIDITLVDFVSRVANWFLREHHARRGETKIPEVDLGVPMAQDEDGSGGGRNTDKVRLREPEETNAEQVALEWSKNQAESEQKLEAMKGSQLEMDAAFSMAEIESPRQQRFRDMTYHIAVHSYESRPEIRSREFNVSLLKLSAIEWKQVSVKQKEDRTDKWNAVSVSEIYAVLDGTPQTLSQLIVDRVRAWHRAGRFALIKTENMELPVLFTQSTMVREAGAEDTTGVMVAVIPPGIQSKLVTADDLYDQTDADLSEYLRMDLRKELLLLTHEYVDHQAPPTMFRLIRQVAMWPNLKADCRAHFDACRRCIELREYLRNVGSSVTELQLLKHLYIDVWKLPKSIIQRTGCIGVLVMVDAAGGMTRYCSIKSEAAEDCAWVIIRHWIAVFGIMPIISSDNAPGFAAEVFRHVMALFGIQHQFAAVHDSRHMGRVETRHNPLKKTVMNALAKGDILSRDDLELYLAFLEMKVNQLTVSEDLKTTFELYFAQAPNTIMDTLTESDMTRLTNIKPVKHTDTTLVGKLRVHVLDMMKSKKAYDLSNRNLDKECRTRSTVLHRDVLEDSKVVTQQQLKVGEDACFGKETVMIKKLYCNSSGNPITVDVVDNKMVAKKVRMDELKPLGSHRKQHIIPRKHTLNAGDFVFYEENDNTYAGKVKSVLTDGFTVHDWGATSSGNKYLPLWITKEGKPPQRGPAKQPAGSKAHVTTVPHAMLLMVGDLNEHNALTEQTVDACEARGITLSAT